MKKILLVIVFLFVLAGAGLAVFIMTFDADSLRPVAEDQLTRALGNPVKIGQIRLGWDQGIALEVDGVEIQEEGRKTGRPAMELESVTAHVRLLPLLRKDLEVGSIILERPRLTLVRDEEGTIRLAGINPSAAAPSGESRASGAALPFFVNVLKIENGQLRFVDEYEPRTTQTSSRPQPREIVVRDVDVTLRDVSLFRPVEFEAGLSVLSPGQNIRLEGLFRIPLGDRPGLLENFVLTTDLSELDPAMMKSAAPELAAAGLRSLSRGRVEMRIARLELSETGLTELEAGLTVRDGAFELEGLKSPVEDLSLTARIHANRLLLEEVSARVADGTVRMTGRVEGFDREPVTELKLAVEKIALGALLPNQPPGQPELRGRLGLDAAMTARGLTAERLLETLNGSGTLILRDGMVMNLNLLNEVIGKLSVIPGLRSRLEEKLPAEYRERLNARDTQFEPVDQPFSMAGGQLLLNPIRIATENFRLTGSGSVSFAGALNFQNLILIDPALSEAMISSVRELQYLLNEEGWMVIPVRMQGTAAKPSVMPDLTYVAQKLAVRKTQELIGGFLGQNREPAPAPAGSPPAAGTAAPAPSPTPAPSGSGQPLLTQTLGRLLGDYGAGSAPAGTPEAGTETAKTPVSSGTARETPQSLLFGFVESMLEAEGSKEGGS